MAAVVKLKSLSELVENCIKTENWLQTKKVDNKPTEAFKNKITEKYFHKEIAVKLFLYKLSSKIFAALHHIDYNASELKFQQYLAYLVNDYFQEENLINSSKPDEVITLDKSLESMQKKLSDFILTVIHFEHELITTDKQNFSLTAVDRSLICDAFKALNTDSLGEDLREDIIHHFEKKYNKSKEQIEQILKNCKSLPKSDSFKNCIREIAIIVLQMEMQRNTVIEKYDISDKVIQIQGTNHVESYITVINKYLEMNDLETDGNLEPSSIFFNKTLLQYLVCQSNPFRNKNSVQTNILVRKLLNVPQLLPYLSMYNFKSQIHGGLVNKILKRLLTHKEPNLPSEILIQFIKLNPVLCSSDTLKQLWEIMVTNFSIMDSQHVCALFIEKELGVELKEIVETSLSSSNVSSLELKAAKKYLENIITTAIKQLYDKGETFFETFRQVLHHDSGFKKLKLVKILLVKQQIELTDFLMIQAERLPTISLFESLVIDSSVLFSCKSKIQGLLKRFDAMEAKPPIYYMCLSDLAFVYQKLGEWKKAEDISRALFYELTTSTLEDISTENWRRVLESKLYKEIQEIHPTHCNLSKIAKDVAYANREMGGKIYDNGKRLDSQDANEKLSYFQKSLDIYLKLIRIEDDYSIPIRFTIKLMVDTSYTCVSILKTCRQKHLRIQSPKEEMYYLLIQGEVLVRAVSLGEEIKDAEYDELHSKNKIILANCIGRMRQLLEGDSLNKLSDQIGKVSEIVDKLEFLI